jgi:hypothetical protein
MLTGSSAVTIAAVGAEVSVQFFVLWTGENLLPPVRDVVVLRVLTCHRTRLWDE